MKIISIDMCLDGGTILIITDKGEYCINNKIGSKYIGHVFEGYPEEDYNNHAPAMALIIKNLLEYMNPEDRYVKGALKLLERSENLL